MLETDVKQSNFSINFVFEITQFKEYGKTGRIFVS